MPQRDITLHRQAPLLRPRSIIGTDVSCGPSTVMAAHFSNGFTPAPTITSAYSMVVLDSIDRLILGRIHFDPLPESLPICPIHSFLPYS